ncbi:Phenylalanyl-tRNA synthetase beta chain [Spirochaeta thermophila DSM 6578]|uniref:Phenylalanine--tRNA ligase beta subunit n=1 Tax=Winmispira thermophila (strain ATCC 700085 / DSM 6578 / Z-1203) TaxID=869211 RepID=G0GG01_WINT7|nr:phenylalanine--tRNA ligase subunit beta [Spirochaeta thermophila]AEJ62477.1 Phenylalanyl-tRNA synthetase beta chain [Spirochaeta thermophila DSM 6578]
MPKIEISRDKFFDALGRRFSYPELEELLTVAKGELDDVDEEEGLLKIELNDTNRPDLWSLRGLVRQLRTYLGEPAPTYPFISRPNERKESGERTIEVDPGLREIRPYIAGFVARGRVVDDDILRDLIQTQEKLCWNFGQKRKAVAMGIYRSTLIRYPVQYKAADPDRTRFVPLSMEKELSLREILREHPKGQEFGWIVEHLPAYPFLTDARGEVLSFPPIINSARIGAVEVGDEELFVELTGLDLKTILLACTIVACDMADEGFEILPVKVVYPYDTPMGRELTTPFAFQTVEHTTRSAVEKLLGLNLTSEEISQALTRMGVSHTIEGDTITIVPPVYRNDFLHPVDIAEDIMIGHGMDRFDPEMPRDFTVGRLSAAEERNRRVKMLMVGMGFQEMIFNYLGSRRDFIEKMRMSDEDAIRVANPLSENYEYVRPSVLPSLLAAESVSSHAVYPHHIFETGKVAKKDPEDNYGSKTYNMLGFLSADPKADFNMTSSHVAALCYYLGKEYTLEPKEDPRFVPGRTAALLVGGREVGIFGEVHPEVLENWGITMPCAACEINLDILFEAE